MPLSQSQPFSRNYKLIKTEDEKQRKGVEDIITLKKLLKLKGRYDLETLLEDCTSEVEESSQYGSFLFSIISTFWIYAPPEKLERLEQISENDKYLLLELAKKIYPPKEYSPEIREIKFRVLTENIKKQKDKDKQLKNNLTQTKKTFAEKRDEPFLQKYLIPIIIGIIVTVVGGIILNLIF